VLYIYNASVGKLKRNGSVEFGDGRRCKEEDDGASTGVRQ